MHFLHDLRIVDHLLSFLVDLTLLFFLGCLFHSKLLLMLLDELGLVLVLVIDSIPDLCVVLLPLDSLLVDLQLSPLLVLFLMLIQKLLSDRLVEVPDLTELLFLFFKTRCDDLLFILLLKLLVEVVLWPNTVPSGLPSLSGLLPFFLPLLDGFSNFFKFLLMLNSQLLFLLFLCLFHLFFHLFNLLFLLFLLKLEVMLEFLLLLSPLLNFLSRDFLFALHLFFWLMHTVFQVRFSHIFFSHQSKILG